MSDLFENDEETTGGGESEDRGDPTGAYQAVMDNDGEVPFSLFEGTAAEKEAEERAGQDYSRMEKEKEMNEDDDD